MIDPELAAKLDEIGAKADRAFEATEKIRKYLFWSAVTTVAVIVLPLIGLLFAIPSFLSSYTDTVKALGY
jgi:hypothetical protein